MEMNESLFTGTRLTKTSREAVRVAIEKGIEYKKLENGRVLLTNGKKKYKFRSLICSSYNSRLAKRTTDQKEVASRLLRSRGFNAPENTVFLKEDLDRAWKWAEPVLPVVIKPHNSTLGNKVYVNVKSYEDFKDAFTTVGNRYNSVLVEKMEKGDEYRFTFLRGEIIAITKRVKAHVIGDGKSSIEELINKKNSIRKKRNNPLHKEIKISDGMLRLLNKQGFELNSVPGTEVKILLSNKMNISNGAEGIDYTDNFSEEIKETVAKAAKTIPGLRVAGMDVLINGNDTTIIEINADPNLLMHDYPWEGKSRNVIEKLLESMFK